MSTKAVVSYFNITGLGEPVRFMLAFCGVDFDDYRMDKDEWEYKKTGLFTKIITNTSISQLIWQIQGASTINLTDYNLISKNKDTSEIDA
jgi:hypothetical protein